VTHLDSVEIFTFRRCLRLCIPALLVGAIVRILFMVSIPEAGYDPDGGSYFDTADRFYNNGEWKLGEKRRWIYPVLMVAMPPLPGTTAQTVAAFQHAAGLLGVVGIGWITGMLTRRRNLWVPATTMLWALWPQALEYEHRVAAETLFITAFITMAAFALPVSALRKRWRLFGMLLSATAVMALKPHGRGIWAAALLAALLANRNILKWGWQNWLVVVLGAAIFLNPGNKRQSNWLWLSSALPLISADGQPWPEYRAALKPAIDQVKDAPLQYPWRQSIYKKRLSKSDPSLISPEWARLAGDKKFTVVAHDLAFSGIKAHPFLYGRIILTKAGLAMTSRDRGNTFEPSVFWKYQDIWNQSRWDDDSKHPELKLLFGWDRQTYDAMRASRSARTSLIAAPLAFIGKSFAWLASPDDLPDGEKSLQICWFGALVALGLFWAATPAHFSSTRIMLLPAFAYLFTVFAVGDALPRYALPLEWIGIVLAAFGLDMTIQFITAQRISTRERSPAIPASAATGA
jgi:hypothetical protein